MNGLTYFCPELLTPSRRLSPALLRIEDGVVTAVEQSAQEPADAVALEGTVVPGLIDLQINGLDTHDIRDGRPETISSISRALLARGVTAWVPTIVTAPEDVRLRALDAIAQARSTSDGARILGAHLEGPWIAPARKGAHDAAVLREPKRGEIERSLGRHPDVVRIVTLAPELSDALEAVRCVVASGAIASIGHSDATYDEAKAAIDAGARMATHVLNAMRPLHQREPGIAGAVLTDERVVAGLIADGIHVHPVNVALVFRTKGAAGIALVSDVVAGGGKPLPDGTLAGSAATLDEGLRVAVATGVPLVDAVAAATLTPATLLDEPYGRLEPGAPADFIVLGNGLLPAATYVGGELVWSA